MMMIMLKKMVMILMSFLCFSAPRMPAISRTLSLPCGNVSRYDITFPGSNLAEPFFFSFFFSYFLLQLSL